MCGQEIGVVGRNVGAEIGGFIGWFVDFSYFFLAIQK